MSMIHLARQGFITKSALPSVTRQRGTTTGVLNLMLYGAGKTTVSNNTTFIDSSANAFTVTRNGDTVQSGFNPFSGVSYGSGYFDGTGDYLTVPMNTAFDFGSGNFTVEAFVYITTTPTNYKSIIGRWGGAGNTNSWNMFFFSNTTRPGFQLNYTGSPGVVSSSTALALNTWHHLALVRNGTTVTLYANGTSVATSNSVGTLVTGVGNVSIGTNLDDIASQSFPGYISNARVVKGTAVYTSNFTPPTAPLTAITNTQLLLLMDNYSIVNSTSTSFPVTIAGNATISTAQSPTGMSSSIYFDGSGDYVTVPNGGLFQFGTGDFTFQWWQYQTGSIFYPRVFSIGTYPTAFGVSIESGSIYYWTNTSSAAIRSAPGLANTWAHIAVSRSSGITRIFLNGSQLGANISDTANISNSSTALSIGAETTPSVNTYFSGYISNFSSIKGVALYTSNFTPSSLPMSTTVTVPNNVTNSIYGVYQLA